MKTCLRVLVFLLLVIGCALPWLPHWSSRPGSGTVTETLVSAEPQPADAASPQFERLFAPVPDEVWVDREAALEDGSVREIVERLQVSGLSADELRRERSRLGEWLETHRAENVVDLLGAWHGLCRVIDGDIRQEYEVNRRKRKLLGQLLASGAD